MSVPIVLKGGVLVTNGTELATDSFGITKVAQAFPIFASMSCRGSNVLGMDQTGNTGTTGTNAVAVTFSNSGASASTYTLAATRAGPTGGAVPVIAARQGYVYTSYVPGIGKQVMLTGILKSGTQPTGMTGAGQAYTRLGVGDDDSGLFWNYDAYTDAVSVVIGLRRTFIKNKTLKVANVTNHHRSAGTFKIGIIWQNKNFKNNQIFYKKYQICTSFDRIDSFKS